MKSKSILLFLLGSSLFFTSCKKTEEAPASTEQKTETTATEKPAANDASKITTTPAPAATQTTPGGQPPKLNPPHGQPYHRCEIAVGAPLDGSSNSIRRNSASISLATAGFSCRYFMALALP